MPPLAQTGLTFCASVACFALGLYWYHPGEPGGAARGVLQCLAIAVAVWIALAVIVGAVTAWRERRAAYRQARGIRALAKRHPDTRITPLSNGRILLTDLATGRTVGDVDASGC